MVVVLTGHEVNATITADKIFIALKHQLKQNTQPVTYSTFLINIS